MKLIHFHHHIIHTADFHLKAAVVRCNKNLTHAFNDFSFKREKKITGRVKKTKNLINQKHLKIEVFHPNGNEHRSDCVT